ncbi:YqhR family membrane protein [Bacillus paralicheniformis]|uniref:YqhR family membrane protein n=1 Tax=Bacillus paralicheniformis TaxID=1648923 RepID=UPI0030DB8585
MTSEKHSEQEEKKKQDDDQQPVSFTGRICGIGFAGGVFWSLVICIKMFFKLIFQHGNNKKPAENDVLCRLIFIIGFFQSNK